MKRIATIIATTMLILGGAGTAEARTANGHAKGRPCWAHSAPQNPIKPCLKPKETKGFFGNVDWSVFR